MKPPADPSGPAFPGAASSAPGPHEAVAQLLRVGEVLRRRWLVWAATTVLCVAAAGLALRLVPPRYQASASLVLHPQGPEVLDKVQGVSEDAAIGDAGYDAYYQTQRAIMGSRAVAERALDRLGLLGDPQALREADGPLGAAPPTADAVERLQRLVSIREVRGSRVVRITAEHPEPERARDLANALAQAYLEHVRSSHRSHGTLAEDNLAQERRAAQQRLDQAEQALQRFKEEHRVTSVSLADRQNVITQDVLTLSARSKEAEADHIHLGSLLDQAQAHYDQGDPLAAMLVLAPGDPTLERLRVEVVAARTAFRAADLEYGPKHAAHQQAHDRLMAAERDLRREVDARLASLRSRVAAARRTEQRLEQSLHREHDRALALGGLEQRHHALSRDARTAEEEFLLIARRDTEVALSNRVELQGIELLDAATTPAAPSFPHQGVALALGALIGLGLGLVLALIIDARDHRLRDLAELERALGADPAPVLGQLPALRSDPRLRAAGDPAEQQRRRDLHVHRFPHSPTAERCRGIRTSLAFVLGSMRRRCIMVTSPGPSEGKSSVALSLALSLCQADKRVVLVDADLRRPRLHTAFDSLGSLDSLGSPGSVSGEGGGGLAAVLTDQAPLTEAIVTELPDAPPGLHLLPCGAPPARPTELLDGPGFLRLLEQLRERYDVVVIDTPPVLPVADPLIVSRAVDGVVMVCRVRRTTRGQLQRTVEQLRRADARLLGVVLNEVDERSGAHGYGYGYGHGHGYDESGHGYRAGSGSDDASSSAAVPRSTGA